LEETIGNVEDHCEPVRTIVTEEPVELVLEEFKTVLFAEAVNRRAGLLVAIIHIVELAHNSHDVMIAQGRIVVRTDPGFKVLKSVDHVPYVKVAYGELLSVW